MFGKLLHKLYFKTISNGAIKDCKDISNETQSKCYLIPKVFCFHMRKIIRSSCGYNKKWQLSFAHPTLLASFIQSKFESKFCRIKRELFKQFVEIFRLFVKISRKKVNFLFLSLLLLLFACIETTTALTMKRKRNFSSF